MWLPGVADTVCPHLSVTQISDHLTLKLVCESQVRWEIFIPNLGMVDLWVLKLFAMYAMDGQTDKSTAYCSVPCGREHNAVKPVLFVCPLFRDFGDVAK